MVERLSAGGGGGEGVLGGGRRSARAAAEVLVWESGGVWVVEICGVEEGRMGRMGGEGEVEGGWEGSVFVVVGGVRICCFGRWL